MLLRSLLAPRAKSEAFDIRKYLSGLDADWTGGAAVTEQSAIRQATVWACVKILSESIASLKVDLFQRVNANSRTLIESHNALDVLHRPNSWMTLHELVQFWVTHMELRGNGYNFKVKNGAGEVRELLPIEQGDVRQNQDWSLTYTIGTDKGIAGEYSQDRILHMRQFGTDGFRGLSTIALHRETIGLALQMEQHGNRLFKNGAQVGLIMEAPNALSDAAYTRLKESLAKEHAGASNAYKSMILEEGLKANRIGMTNEDSQFVDARKLQKSEIAAIFGVPGFLINDTEKSTTWGSGLEQINRGFVNFTLRPRLSRITQALARELLTVEEQRRGYCFAFDTDDFTLGTIKERFEAYAKGIDSGVINPNEARDWENMNPREGGDEYRLPMNVSTEGDPPAPEPAKSTAPTNVFVLPESLKHQVQQSVEVTGFETLARELRNANDLNAEHIAELSRVLNEKLDDMSTQQRREHEARQAQVREAIAKL